MKGERKKVKESRDWGEEEGKSRKEKVKGKRS